MRKFFLATAAVAALMAVSMPAHAQQPEAEKSAVYMMNHTDLTLLDGKPQIMVLNGLDEPIDSITCTMGSDTWTLLGASPDRSVKRNTRVIPSGNSKIIDTDNWSGYCPKGLMAHTQTMDVLGELNIPNDFDKSSRVAFWRRNAR